jgi:hypothetical protein
LFDSKIPNYIAIKPSPRDSPKECSSKIPFLLDYFELEYLEELIDFEVGNR